MNECKVVGRAPNTAESIRRAIGINDEEKRSRCLCGTLYSPIRDKRKRPAGRIQPPQRASNAGRSETPGCVPRRTHHPTHHCQRHRQLPSPSHSHFHAHSHSHFHSHVPTRIQFTRKSALQLYCPFVFEHRLQSLSFSYSCFSPCSYFCIGSGICSFS